MIQHVTVSQDTVMYYYYTLAIVITVILVLQWK